MSHARHIRQCQAKKLTRNVNKTTCTYNVDTYSHSLDEEYSEEGMFNATLDLGVFPCLISTESVNSGTDSPDSGAAPLKNTAPTQLVPDGKHTLINQSTNISNVLLSNLKTDVNDSCPINVDKKKKSQECLKRFIYPKKDPEPSTIIDS